MLSNTYVAHITLNQDEMDGFPIIEYPSPAQKKSAEAWGLGQVLPRMAVQVAGSSRRKQCGCLVRRVSRCSHTFHHVIWVTWIVKTTCSFTIYYHYFYPICFTQLPTHGSSRQNLEQKLCLNTSIKNSQNI